VVLVALQWFGRFVLPILVPAAMPFGVMGGLLFGLLIVLWWVFFSRAPRGERWGAVPLMILAVIGTSFLLHESIATGMMGMMFVIYVVPILCLAFVLWAALSRNLPAGPRRWALVATILLACGVFVFLRTDGMTGDADNDFAFRWSATPEERLLAQTEGEQLAGASTPSTAAEWPGFRGPQRDSVLRGVRIEPDWSTSPPEEMWRRPVGPGWASFAVDGDFFYTQEQRGEDEVVACYKVSTGEPVWRHTDAERFWESIGGAGPRSTPTLSGGRVYTFGATGMLNALDARDGSVLWSRNVQADTEVPVPGWGFSSSPLVVEDVVVVAASGKLAAYDQSTGAPRWKGPDSGGDYSSPHLLTLDGVPQVLLLTRSGAIGVEPTDGTLLWEYEWKSGERIVQPAVMPGGDLLITAGESRGLRRVTATHASNDWTFQEHWTTNRLKPYFNDFVVHKGHAYGFDGTILAAISLEDGERVWKGGRYGNGQLLLLADQDLLLVLSEKGELALVNATPDQFTERARFPAIEGKTWNHPVLVNGVLLVRNAEEMAAFRLR